MGKDTKIEWAHHTFNPWRGCTKVSAGCKNCYAETLSARNPAVLGKWGINGTRVIASESAWLEPVKWNRIAQEAGERHRVFCASLGDVFEGLETMPFSDIKAVNEARGKLWRLIEETPALDWLLLTKRPQNIAVRSPVSWYLDGFPSNVWIGTSVENQEAAEERIPELLKIPAKVRFLSCEPLLGAVDLSKWLWVDMPGHPRLGRIHWVIVGGESGQQQGVRPMHPEWVLRLLNQCVEAEVPFFFKQWGAWLPKSITQVKKEWVLERSMELIRSTTVDSTRKADIGKVSYHAIPSPVVIGDGDEWVTVPILERVGKSAAGNVLSGETWEQVPSVQEVKR